MNNQRLSPAEDAEAADALDAAAITPAAMALANMNAANANITGETMNTSQINVYWALLYNDEFFVFDLGFQQKQKALNRFR